MSERTHHGQRAGRNSGKRAGKSAGKYAGKGAGRHAGKSEEKQQAELLYGLHTARAALLNPARRIRAAWATTNALKKLEGAFHDSGVRAQVVHPKELARKLEPEAVHQGVLLKADPLPEPALGDVAAADGIIVLLDQITDPHNIGAILRSAAAFGVNAVITTRRHAPAATSGVLAKAASGALEHVPLVKVTNLARAIEELRQAHDYAVWGLDSAAEGRLGCRSPAPRRVALALGAEGKGLRARTRSLCDALLRLDMPGAIHSLNVSNAAAISLFALHESMKAREEKA